MIASNILTAPAFNSQRRPMRFVRPAENVAIAILSQDSIATPQKVWIDIFTTRFAVLQ